MNVINQQEGQGWIAYHGDSCEVLRGIPESSVHFSIYSPPFEGMYIYNASERDLANSRGPEEFFAHYRFIIGELLRVTVPGRLSAVHCWLTPVLKSRDGYIGLRDFRGEIIRAHQDAGWIFHSETCINKDPVVQMHRTKALGLLHKTIRTDSSMSRMGLADFLCVFRKPGQNPEAIKHTSEEYPVSKWQRVAEPVWNDIDPSDTLQRNSAREDADEKHIAPLQLEVIRRAIELWSNEGDRVLSPFMGIGSEGFVAREMGRRFIGVELKASYYRQAVENVRSGGKQLSLFGGAT